MKKKLIQILTFRKVLQIAKCEEIIKRDFYFSLISKLVNEPFSFIIS